MKKLNKKYKKIKLAAGVQAIKPDSPDYSDVYKSRAEFDAKKQQVLGAVATAGAIGSAANAASSAAKGAKDATGAIGAGATGEAGKTAAGATGATGALTGAANTAGAVGSVLPKPAVDATTANTYGVLAPGTAAPGTTPSATGGATGGTSTAPPKTQAQLDADKAAKDAKLQNKLNLASIGSTLVQSGLQGEKGKGAAVVGGALEGGTAGMQAGMAIGGPVGAAIGGGLGLLAGGFASAEQADKEAAIKKRAVENAQRSTAQKAIGEGHGTDIQGFVNTAKKGKYKVHAKQPRMIETEGREPIFSPPDKNGKRKLLYYNPNDPTHEEGGVKAMVIPKKEKGVNKLEGNLISKVIMNRNKDKDFVQRANAVGQYPNSNMFIKFDPNEFGQKNTHLMSWGTDDRGQAYMQPEIMNPKNEIVKVPNQYADYISNEGYKKATGMMKKDGAKGVSLSVGRGEKDPKGGLTQKGVSKYNRETGSHLKMAVTTPPSQLKAGSEPANRRKSFCARMSGLEGPMKKPNGEPTRKALALRKWNCEDGVENIKTYKEGVKDMSVSKYKYNTQPSDVKWVPGSFKEGVKSLPANIEAARKQPGGSNVGKKTFASGEPRTGPYAGPSGGAPKGSYPIPDIGHAKAAIKMSGHAPNPAGIKSAVYRKYPELKPDEKNCGSKSMKYNKGVNKVSGKEMIERADGSTSQRGLWDNIRANKGSGKEPTPEMLKQEKKINRKYNCGCGKMKKYKHGTSALEIPEGSSIVTAKNGMNHAAMDAYERGDHKTLNKIINKMPNDNAPRRKSHKSSYKKKDGDASTQAYPAWFKAFVSSNTEAGRTSPTGQSTLLDPKNAANYYNKIKELEKERGKPFTGMKDLQEHVYDRLGKEGQEKMWGQFGHTLKGKDQSKENFADDFGGARTAYGFDAMTIPPPKTPPTPPGTPPSKTPPPVTPPPVKKPFSLDLKTPFEISARGRNLAGGVDEPILRNIRSERYQTINELPTINREIDLSQQEAAGKIRDVSGGSAGSYLSNMGNIAGKAYDAKQAAGMAQASKNQEIGNLNKNIANKDIESNLNLQLDYDKQKAENLSAYRDKMEIQGQSMDKYFDDMQKTKYAKEHDAKLLNTLRSGNFTADELGNVLYKGKDAAAKKGLKNIKSKYKKIK